MRVVLTCPSYRRPHVETLETYPSARVYVAESEHAAYLDANPSGADIVAVDDRWQGNVARIRNRILDEEFEGGADAVVMIDDDVKDLAYYYPRGSFGYREHVLNERELLEFIEEGCVLCDEWGLKMWGVADNYDYRTYRHATPFSTLSFIGGPFCCFLKNPIRYDERFYLKEDYDIFLQHVSKYRGALRFNAYHYHCRQCTNEGGCANSRTSVKEREQFNMLRTKWGSEIIRVDGSSMRGFDFNPRVRVPIKGV